MEQCLYRAENLINLCFSASHLNHFPSDGMLVTHPRKEKEAV